MTPAQAAIRALDAQRDEPAPEEPVITETVPETPQGIDVSQLTMEQYAQLRQQMGIGQGRQYGRGILDGGNSRSQAHLDGVRANIGRTTYGKETHAVIERQFVKEPDRRDQRPARDRFSNPWS
jgi:hypothetical protein